MLLSHLARRGLAVASPIVLMGTLGMPSAVYAQMMELNIPAQPLSSALQTFGQQTGMEVLYSAELVKGINSKELVLNAEPVTALQRLLDGTGLHAQVTGKTAYLTATGDADTIQLGVTSVTGNGLGSVTQGSGSYTTGSVSIGRDNRSIRETPQTVSVITQQRIQDQNLKSLTEVMNQTTGVTLFQGTNLHSRYLSRGFEITNMRVDGGANVRSPGDGGGGIDMAMYDHVEVLRGVDGLYSGAGEPGGAINLVRKKPTADAKTSVAIEGGSWNTRRTDIDVSGPLGLDGKLRGRAVVAYEKKDYFYDSPGAENKLFYGVLESDFTDDLTVTAGVSRVLLDTAYQGYGLPRASTGESLNLPRSTFLSGKDDFLKKDTNSVFLEAKQLFSNNWSLNFSSVYTEFDQLRDNYFFAGAVDTSTGEGVSGGWTRWYETFRDVSTDLNLKGQWDMFGLTHDFIFGYDYRSQNQNGKGPAGDYVNIPNIYTFSPADYPDYADEAYYGWFNQKTVQSGFYGNSRFALSDSMHLILGGRLSNYRYQYYNLDYEVATSTYGTPDNVPYSDKHVFTPYGGLTYDFDENWTGYGSVAEIYKSQASSMSGPAPGTPLDPITGTNYEVGLKGSFYDGRLNTTAALYYIKREGAAVRDPAYPRTTGARGEQCCYLADGEVISRGIDLEVSGEIIPRLQATVGYTLNLNQDKSTGTASSTRTPKHLFKAYAGYQLAGALSALRIGGGVTAQSSSYNAGEVYIRDAQGVLSSDPVSYKFSQGGYAVWNTFATYKIDQHWSLAANANNLFDKVYYSTSGDSTYGNFYGDPRNYTLTLRGDF